jgi:hypothetical protein
VCIIDGQDAGGAGGVLLPTLFLGHFGATGYRLQLRGQMCDSSMSETLKVLEGYVFEVSWSDGECHTSLLSSVAFSRCIGTFTTNISVHFLYPS